MSEPRKINLDAITIGSGLGELKFGSTRDEVRALLGEPEEVEEFAANECDDAECGEEHAGAAETWVYDELGFSCHFDEEDGFRLSTISLFESGYSILGTDPIGMTEEAAIAFANDQEWGDVSSEELEFEDGAKGKLVEFDAASLSFWFEEGKMVEVQWTPFWDEDDNIVWPA